MTRKTRRSIMSKNDKKTVVEAMIWAKLKMEENNDDKYKDKRDIEHQ